MKGTPSWEIPLAHTEIGEEEVAAVTRVLRSGWLTAGPETQAFEGEFAERCGARHAVAVANGTAALHLAYLAVGLGPGDELICPALTFVAAANAALYVGAEVVFADVVSARDLGVDPHDIARRITPRTRALSVLHYGGFPCDMTAILEIARRHNLAVIEDCAHAPLARHVDAMGNARAVGTLGHVGCFSFFGNKNMTTGEGGMLTTDDDDLAARLRLLRSHGMTSASWDRFRGHAADYDVVALGYNYRIDDLRAALGRVQLGRLDDLHRRRREVVGWYRCELASVEGVVLPFADRDLALAAPHVLSLVIETGAEARRRRLIEAGIQVSRHYAPVNGFTIHGGDRTTTPRLAALELLTLPLGPQLDREQVRRIVAILRGD